MKQLNINITKAQLISYSVEMKDGKPLVRATCQLLTDGGKPVTTYSASTKQYDWETSSDFELPFEAIKPIVELARILEAVVVKNCRDSQLTLGSGMDSDPITEEDLSVLTLPAGEVVEAEVKEDKVSDEPINLDDIPF